MKKYITNISEDEEQLKTKCDNIKVCMEEIYELDKPLYFSLANFFVNPEINYSSNVFKYRKDKALTISTRAYNAELNKYLIINTLKEIISNKDHYTTQHKNLYKMINEFAKIYLSAYTVEKEELDTFFNLFKQNESNDVKNILSLFDNCLKHYHLNKMENEKENYNFFKKELENYKLDPSFLFNYKAEFEPEKLEKIIKKEVKTTEGILPPNAETSKLLTGIYTSTHFTNFLRTSNEEFINEVVNKVANIKANVDCNIITLEKKQEEILESVVKKLENSGKEINNKIKKLNEVKNIFAKISTSNDVEYNKKLIIDTFKEIVSDESYSITNKMINYLVKKCLSDYTVEKKELDTFFELFKKNKNNNVNNILSLFNNYLKYYSLDEMKNKKECYNFFKENLKDYNLDSYTLYASLNFKAELESKELEKIIKKEGETKNILPSNAETLKFLTEIYTLTHFTDFLTRSSEDFINKVVNKVANIKANVDCNIMNIGNNEKYILKLVVQKLITAKEQIEIKKEVKSESNKEVTNVRKVINMMNIEEEVNKLKNSINKIKKECNKIVNCSDNTFDIYNKSHGSSPKSKKTDTSTDSFIPKNYALKCKNRSKNDNEIIIEFKDSESMQNFKKKFSDIKLEIKKNRLNTILSKDKSLLSENKILKITCNGKTYKGKGNVWDIENNYSYYNESYSSSPKSEKTDPKQVEQKKLTNSSIPESCVSTYLKNKMEIGIEFNNSDSIKNFEEKYKLTKKQESNLNDLISSKDERKKIGISNITYKGKTYVGKNNICDKKNYSDTKTK